MCFSAQKHEPFKPNDNVQTHIFTKKNILMLNTNKKRKIINNLSIPTTHYLQQKYDFGDVHIQLSLAGLQQ